MNKKQTVLCIFWTLTISLSFCEKGIADDWSLSLYGGVLLKGNLSDGSLLYSGFEDSYFLTLALSKRVASYKDKIDLELEGQTVKHFEGQEHWEFNGLAALRWLPFPWDSLLVEQISRLSKSQ